MFDVGPSTLEKIVHLDLEYESKMQPHGQPGLGTEVLSLCAQLGAEFEGETCVLKNIHVDSEERRKEQSFSSSVVRESTTLTLHHGAAGPVCGTSAKIGRYIGYMIISNLLQAV